MQMDLSRRRVFARASLFVLLAGLVASPLPSATDTQQPARVELTQHRVTGRVLSPQGAPLAAATVWVRTVENAYGGLPVRGHWTHPVQGRTEEDGSFAVELPLAGPYAVVATHAEHAGTGYSVEVDGLEPIEMRLGESQAFAGTVHTADGEPIPNADVLACNTVAISMAPGACSSTRSDAQGNFSFGHLSAGLSRFQAWAPGHTISRSKRRDLPADADKALVLTLHAGAELGGQILDDRGDPVAGAQIQWIAEQTQKDSPAVKRNEGRPLFREYSAADGSFALRGLPAESPLKVLAEVTRSTQAESETITLASGSVTSGLVIRYERMATATVRLVDADDQPATELDVRWERLPNADEADAAPAAARRSRRAMMRVEIEALDAGNFELRQIPAGRYDITLVPEGYLELELKGVQIAPGQQLDLGQHIVRAGKRLKGRVLDDLDQPIPAAKVNAFYRSDGRLRSRMTHTNEEGRFTLGGLGETVLQRVDVNADGYAKTILESVEPDQDGLEIVLQRVGVVRGRALLQDGKPVANVDARLELAGSSFAVRRDAGSPTRGDDEGVFEIADAPPGEYMLVLVARGVRARKIPHVVVEPGVTHDVGEQILEAGLALSGTTRDRADGTALTGVVVAARPLGGMMFGRSDRSGIQTTTSDEEGHFRLDGLVPGRHTVSAEHPAYAVASQEVELLEELATDEIEALLGRGGTLTGTVRDTQERPLPGRSLMLMPSGSFEMSKYRAQTDEAGRYRIERLEPGSYRVILAPDRPEDAMDMRQKVATLRENEETVVNFGNEAKIEFEGRITKQGRALGDVNVVMVSAEGDSLASMKTARANAQGEFQLRLESPGTYLVVVQNDDGSSPGRSQVVVPDELFVALEIDLAGAAIGGRITDSDGEALQNARVGAVADGSDPADFRSQHGAATQPDGSYRIEGLAAGRHTVTAVAEGYHVATRDVTVDAGAASEGVDFRLEASSEVRGRVVDAHGNGLAMVLVLAQPSGSTNPSGGLPAESDLEGFFTLSAPSKGAIDLIAIGKGFAPGALDGYTPQADRPGPTIVLESGVQLELRVLDAEGQPVSGLVPQLESDRFRTALALTSLFNPILPTNQEGRVSLPHLPQGPLRVSIAGHPEFPTQTITLSGPGPLTVTLRQP